MKRGLKVAIAPLFIFFTNRPQWKEDWKAILSRLAYIIYKPSMKRGLKEKTPHFWLKLALFRLNEKRIERDGWQVFPLPLIPKASMKRGLKEITGTLTLNNTPVRPQWKEDWKIFADNMRLMRYMLCLNEKRIESLLSFLWKMREELSPQWKEDWKSYSDYGNSGNYSPASMKRGLKAESSKRNNSPNI